MSLHSVNSLDTAIFKAIPSQTSEGDRRSLLAIQRATAKRHPEFNYLEIGSHLGGSIQPYLLDERCKKIYSIDPRPRQQPDDRSQGFVAHYEDNSSERMLGLLRAIGHGDVGKIQCIESDASRIDPQHIQNKPQIAFIDGEHTQAAVMSDFRFCEQVVSTSATILFHDFAIVYPAVRDICGYLKDKQRQFLPLKLEGEVFAIFFDPELVHSDPYLALQYKKNRRFLSPFFKARLKRMTPNFLINALRPLRNALRRPAQVTPAGAG